MPARGDSKKRETDPRDRPGGARRVGRVLRAYADATDPPRRAGTDGGARRAPGHKNPEIQLGAVPGDARRVRRVRHACVDAGGRLLAGSRKIEKSFRGLVRRTPGASDAFETCVWTQEEACSRGGKKSKNQLGGCSWRRAARLTRSGHVNRRDAGKPARRNTENRKPTFGIFWATRGVFDASCTSRATRRWEACLRGLEKLKNRLGGYSGRSAACLTRCARVDRRETTRRITQC